MKKHIFYSVIFLLIINYLHGQTMQIQWQKSIGGLQGEYLFDALPTPDYGFILAGSSVSEQSGNKSVSDFGNLDYYLWKLNEKGEQEWETSFGGDGADFLYSVNLTQDGGYILGGSSYSGVSGTKIDSCRGQDDFWIIKLNAAGKAEWQKTFGGAGSDKLLSVQQTSDFGYIVGGSSDSHRGFEKDTENFGSMDFWVIKLDKAGNILWQNSFGGKYFDLLRSVKETSDGYILAGYSNSPENSDPNFSQSEGNKTADNKGEGDFWLVKLDKNGNKVWDKSFGGERDDELTDLAIAEDGGFVMVGNSSSNLNSKDENLNSNPIPQPLSKGKRGKNGTEILVIKTDEYGNLDWEKYIDVGETGVANKILSPALSKGKGVEKETFTIAGSSLSMSNEGESLSEYVAVKIDGKGNVLWKKQLGGGKRDLLQSAAETRGGGLILAGTSNSDKGKDKTVSSNGQTDFWVVKLVDGEQAAISRKSFEVYPNPTERFVNVIIPNPYPSQTESTAKPKTVEVYDMNGRRLQTVAVKYGTTAVDLGGYPSGAYMLKILLKDGAETVKVLKSGNK